jgi:hypothetical protein
MKSETLGEIAKKSITTISHLFMFGINEIKTAALKMGFLCL